MSSASGWRNSRLWAVLLWAATFAAALDFAIYRSVSPQYEARSVLEVHTRFPALYPEASETSADRAMMAQRTLETAIHAIKIDMILSEAVADPSVVNQPSIKASAWPVALVRDRLEVHQIPRTELISVAFKSHEPVEAANIVNAVVRSYADMKRNSASYADSGYMKSLKSYLSAIQKQIQQLKEESPGGEAGIDAAFNGLLAERLLPILLEQAETNDTAKKAELEEKAKRLRSLAHKGSDAREFLEWKSRYESLRRD